MPLINPSGPQSPIPTATTGQVDSLRRINGAPPRVVADSPPPSVRINSVAQVGFEALEATIGNIKQLIQQVLDNGFLNKDAEKYSLKTIVSEHRKQLVKEILSSNPPPSFSDIHATIQTAEDTVESLMNAASDTTQLLEWLNMMPGSVSSGVSFIFNIFQTAQLLRQTHQRASALIWEYTVLAEVKAELDDMRERLTHEPDNETLKGQIETLGAWLQREGEAVNDEAAEVATDYAPSPILSSDRLKEGTGYAATAVSQFKKVWYYFKPGLHAVGHGLSVVADFLNIVYYTLKLHHAKRNFEITESWNKKFKKNPVALKYLNRLNETAKNRFYDSKEVEFRRNIDKWIRELPPQTAFYTLIMQLGRRQIHLNKAKGGKEVKDLDSFKKQWMQNPDFRQDLIKQYVAFSAGAETIHELYNKKKQEYLRREKEAENEWMPSLEAIPDDKPWGEVLRDLAAKGVHPDKIWIELGEISDGGSQDKARYAIWKSHGGSDRTIASVEDLKESLKIPEYRQAVLKAYLHHKEAVPVSTKNSLLVIREKKYRVEKNFVKLKLAEALSCLGVATVATALSITAKFATVAAIATLATAALVTTGIGGAAAAVLLLGIGTYMFYKFKPNLFKEWTHLVNTRITFYNIPRAIHKHFWDKKNLNRHIALAKLEKVNLDLQTLKDGVGTLDNTQDEEFLKLRKAIYKKELKQAKIDDEIKQIDKDLQKLQEKIDKWQAKITPLQTRWDAAALRDMARDINPVDEGAKQDLIDKVSEGLMAMMEDTSTSEDEIVDMLKALFIFDLPIQQYRKQLATGIMPEEQKAFKELFESRLNKFLIMDDSDLTSAAKKYRRKLKLEAA